MIRKIIILALILLGGYLFYKHFVAPSVEPFFKQRVEFGLNSSGV